MHIFRLILIAEKDKVYEEFPTPLINRLEKHFVVTSTVLTENQKLLLEEVKTWANKYACVRLVIIDFFVVLCYLIEIIRAVEILKWEMRLLDTRMTLQLQ